MMWLRPKMERISFETKLRTGNRNAQRHQIIPSHRSDRTMILEHMLRTPKVLRLHELVGNCGVRPLVLVGKYGGGGLVEEAPDLRMLDRVVDHVPVGVAGLLRDQARCKMDDVVVGALGAYRPHGPVEIALQVGEVH